MTRLRQHLARKSPVFEASETANGDARRRAFPVLVAVALAGALAAGCSGSGGVGKTVGGWFGSDTASATKKTLYAKIDGLVVHTDAKNSSKSVGTLNAGEKVSRGKVSGAWAYVEARGGRVKGWVPAAQLGSRPAAVAGTPGQPGATTATGEEVPGGEAEAVSGEAGAASGEAGAASEETPDETSEEEVSADEATGETPEAAAVPAPAPVEEPVGPKPGPARKGKVAPSVFDPY